MSAHHRLKDFVHVVLCDRPGCMALVEGTTARTGARTARDRAEAAGWQIASADVDIDLCPDHIDETRPVKITRLYDEDGKPVNKMLPSIARKAH